MAPASVIVPAFNAAATIGDTLRALAAQETDADYEVIVVDDGSSDDTVDVARTAAPQARILEQENLGPAAARNLGVSVAKGEALAFTDADCVPEPGWLAAGLEALADAGLVQGAVRPDPSATRLPFDRTVWVSRETGLYECASLFMRRDAFERIGGFEDWLGARMGKELGEDAWLGWRHRMAGGVTAFEPCALVNHAVFRRGALPYVKERARLVYFPTIVARMPGLRSTLLWYRVFISRRAAAFDLACLSGIAAAAVAWPLVVGAVPYAVIALSEAVRWRRHAPRLLAGSVAADAVALVALVAGALRARTVVL